MRKARVADIKHFWCRFLELANNGDIWGNIFVTRLEFEPTILAWAADTFTTWPWPSLIIKQPGLYICFANGLTANMVNVRRVE
jgi:hypothetical protein